MPRHTLLALIWLSSLLPATSALAQDNRFELTISGISSRMDGRFSDDITSDLTRASDRDTGYSISAAWRINPRWALGLEYADHGTLDGFNLCPPELFCIAAESPEFIDASSVTLSLAAAWPISDHWDIFGRVGYAETDLDRRFAGDTDDSSAVFGAGLIRELGQSTDLVIEHRVEAADLQRTSAGIMFRF
ncbi:MAG: outer membrane beta-barrel protein [Xanthomonadales bacterium]|nr:outer membrane beta-barrel protein [Xanthomonadales bacterium]